MSMRTFILAVTGFGLSVAACSSYGTSVVEVRKDAAVASVSIALPASSLVAGHTLRATATLKDANGSVLSDRPVSWSTSSPSIATATDSGMIYALAPGNAVVNAVSEGVSGHASVTVTPPPPPTVAALSVAVTPAAVVVGQTAHAIAAVKDSAGNVLSDRSVTWKSANTSIAVVSTAGDVSAVAPGSTSISATSEGVSASAPFSVAAPAPVAVASVSVAPATSTIQVGATAQFTATTRDAANNTLTGRAVVWSTSNSSVATVSTNGLATAVAAGSATISASSEGIVGSAALTVTAPAPPPPPPPAPVAVVSVTPSTSTLVVGNTTQLSATTKDANNNTLTGRVVTWSSANSNIASVNSNGVVSAVGAGTTQVTALSEGVSGKASVTVTAPAPVPVATVSVSPSSASVQVGSTTQLSASTRDANNVVLTGRVVTWSSGNPAIATVNSSGVVTGVAAGSAQIVATSEGKTGNSTVTVTAPPPPPPPPPPGSSNEPTGMTLIDERPFNSLNEHAAPYSPGWDTDNTLSIQQDATAPKSPSSVIRVTFPSGFAGGSSNGHTGVAFGGRRVLYISYWMKYSSNWVGHNTGINKHAYAWVSENGGYTPFVMEAEGFGTGALKPRPILQRMIVGDGNYEPNLVPGATIPRGAWFQIEIVLTGNSAGTADGSMDIYLNGVHVTSASRLQWTNGATSWNIFELYPVWGGIGDTVPATQWLDWDHVYLSGKN